MVWELSFFQISNLSLSFALGVHKFLSRASWFLIGLATNSISSSVSLTFNLFLFLILIRTVTPKMQPSYLKTQKKYFFFLTTFNLIASAKYMLKDFSPCCS